MTTEVSDTDADTDCALLFTLLPEKWAQLPASDDGEDLALAFIRAAYGRGYVAGLEESSAR